jgi:RecA-family ATPase
MRPVLVVVDNVAAIYGGDQNIRGMVRAFMNLWRGVARASGAAILLLNHPSLSGLTAGTGRGGSMDWRNTVRAALHLKPANENADADRGVRILECVKNNYAAQGRPVRLEWTDGVLTVEGTASPLQRAAQDAQADEKFLALLALHTRLGVDVGPSPGQNYAPKVFAEHAENGGYRKQAFATTMHRLQLTGRIVVEEQGPASRRRKRLAIVGRTSAQ